MNKQERNVLAYSSQSRMQNFVEASTNLWRLTPTPLTSELVVPTAFLMICGVGLLMAGMTLFTVASGKLSLRPWDFAMVLMAAAALASFVAASLRWLRLLSQAGNQPVLIDITPRAIRIYAPRFCKPDIEFAASHIRSIHIKRCGWTLSMKRRYAIIISSRFNPDIIWGETAMHYFIAENAALCDGLRATFRDIGYDCE